MMNISLPLVTGDGKEITDGRSAERRIDGENWLLESSPFPKVPVEKCRLRAEAVFRCIFKNKGQKVKKWKTYGEE